MLTAGVVEGLTFRNPLMHAGSGGTRMIDMLAGDPRPGDPRSGDQHRPSPRHRRQSPVAGDGWGFYMSSSSRPLVSGTNLITNSSDRTAKVV